MRLNIIDFNTRFQDSLHLLHLVNLGKLLFLKSHNILKDWKQLFLFLLTWFTSFRQGQFRNHPQGKREYES